MHALVDDVLGKVVQKVQDMLHHGLVGQAAQPYAVLGGARGDEMLWGMGKLRAQVSVASVSCQRVEGVASGGTHLRQQRQLHGGQLCYQRRLAMIVRLIGLRVHRSIEHLLHLRGRRPKQLNIPLANGLAMPSQRLGRITLIGEQHKGIASGASIGFLYKQNALIAVEHMARRLASGKEVQLQMTERQ